MAVLLSVGQKNLNKTLHHILDTFKADIDYTRGFFIKPNIVFPVKPGNGEITSPTLVEALISTLRERYGDIDIVIGEGVAAGCDPWENFRVSGYARLAQELAVPLIDLHTAERKTLMWKFGKLKLPNIVLDRTYINLPILKPSSACVISGALKNQKGLLLPAVKKQFHRLGLHEQISELNTIIQPSLTIMDCGRFFDRHVLISGNNCGEIDATACYLLDIKEPEHVQLSRNTRVFEPGSLVMGDRDFKRRKSMRPEVNEYKHIGRLRLWSNPQACTMCRYLFHDLQHGLLKGQNLLGGVKLLTLSLKGAEMIMGSNPEWRKEYDTVICVGVCTRPVAEDGGYIYIPGCPPCPDDFYNHLPKLGSLLGD